MFTKIKYQPFSLEAERSVIGGLLLDSSKFIAISQIVTTQDFYDELNKEIFSYMSAMTLRGEHIDTVTVADYIHSRTAFGSPFSYLINILNCTPSSRFVEAYANVVAENSRLRKLISGINSSIDMINNKGESSIDDLINKVQFNMNNTFQDVHSNIKNKNKLSEQLSHDVEMFISDFKGDMTNCIPTGFAGLDSLLTGLIPGYFYIIAGRPSMGKTTFAINIMGSILELKKDIPVLFISLEMSRKDIVLKLLSSMSMIPQKNILSQGLLSDHQTHKLKTAYQAIRTSELYIDETASLTPSKIFSITRKLYNDTGGGLGVIIIDYLQLITGNKNNASINRVQEVSEISRTLKLIAKELNIPVIALSQLNRNLDERIDKRPMLSDLRESGALEQDADVVLFVYRDEMYHKSSTDKGTAEIIVGKQRNGPIGKILLQFQGAISLFSPAHFKTDNHTMFDILE